MVMATKEASSYEETRRRRVEENKKRMEALNLPKLSRNLHSISVKTSPMKKCRTREKQMVIVRRSTRLSNSSSSAPIYKEVVLQRVQLPRRGLCNGRNMSNRAYVSDELREEAISRAEKLQAGLESDVPCFVKAMLPSHVSGGFWLGLPADFCRSKLRKQDGVMTLINEEGEEFETVYLARKNGLSGGWMGFSIAHNLMYGDALVFQLVRPSAFKVYIARVGS
ncbi:unnamed protein product [Cochlearia groenlandica]